MNGGFLAATCIALAAACTGDGTAAEAEIPTASTAAPAPAQALAAEISSPTTVGPADQAPVAEAPAVDGGSVAEVTAGATAGTAEEPAAETAVVDEGPAAGVPVVEGPVVVEAPVVDEGAVIELVVVGSELEGGARRQSVPLGEAVTVRVSGTSTDQVHIHGYDLFIELANGVGELTFEADIPGVFEIELEGSHTLLAQMEVK